MYFLLSSDIISWECRKQKCIVLFSTESEFIGLSEACRESFKAIKIQNN